MNGNPKAVGYWRSADEPWLPDPATLAAPSWCRDDRDKIVGYLRSGREYRAYLGYSHCRFDCGVDEEAMGCCDLWDGEWVWPEGLAHYIESHGVYIPDEFVEHMRENDWQVPELQELSGEKPMWDTSFWPEWARGSKVKRTGAPLEK